MNHPSVRLTTYARKLRGLLASEDLRVWDALPDLLAQILKESHGWIAHEDREKDLSELRMLLYRLAFRTAQSRLAMTCAQILLHFGRPGRRMALDICSMPKWGEDEVLTGIEHFSPLETLLAIHQVLVCPGETEVFFQTWAKSQLTWAATLEPEIVHDFCVHMGREGNQPCFLLVQHLRAGNFFQWFQGRCTTPFLDKQACENTVCVIHALGKSSYILAFAKHVPRLSQRSQMRFLRTAAHVCREEGEALAKMLVPLIPNMKQEVVFAALRCLIYVQWPSIKHFLGVLGRKRPEWSLACEMMTLLLPAPWSLEKVLETIRSGDPAWNRALLEGICRIDPGGIQTICSQPQWHIGHEKACSQVQHYAKGFSGSHLTPSFAAISPSSPPPNISLTGRLTRLFASKQQPLQEALQTYVDLEDMTFRHDCFTNRTISKCTIKRVHFEDCVFSGTMFNKVRFRGCSFTRTQFVGCQLEHCTLSSCRFNQTTMTNVTIKGCKVEVGDFVGHEFRSCHFQHTTLRGLLLHQVACLHCSLECGEISQCVLKGCWWDDLAMTSMRLMGNAVHETILSQCRWHGVEMISCRLETTTLRSAMVRNTRLEDTELVDCSFEDLDTLEPVLYAAFLETMLWDSRFESTYERALPDNLDTAWVRKLLVMWRSELTAKITEQCMLANNRRRLNLAIDKFSSGQDECFQMLPCLFHGDRFETSMGISGIPRCRIQGFAPDHTQMRLVDKIFPLINKAKPQQQDDTVRIRAIYTIGSLGTVAQNHTSDVDVWICLAGSGPSSDTRSRLVMKCEAISRWADDIYDMNLHFFVMTMDEIRSNNFGELSQEGCGSAQSLLLKEEFYRTSLFIGGMAPRWWSLPCQPLHTVSPFLPSAAIQTHNCDLGDVHSIPKQEFFGASLWQIVGFVRNPYKALLKLGLVEKYALEGASSGTLLSEIIKTNLLQGKQEAYQIDPYALLYKELLLFYGQLGDRDACQLIKENFHAKIKMEEIDLSCEYPARYEEQSVLSFYFQMARIPKSKILALTRGWSMAKTLKMGDAMRTFMLGAYQRIRDNIAAQDIVIRPEEMTVLSRTISSCLGQETGKIRRMFFIGPEKTNYHELYLYTEHSPKGRLLYVAKGRKKHAPRILNHLEVIHRDTDPYRLTAWLAMNRLYKPGMEVSGSPALIPSCPSLQGFMKGVCEVFTPEMTCSVRQQDLLGTKRIMKVLYCLTKGSEHDRAQRARLDILYSTSWGELYSMSVAHPSPDILTKPTLCCAKYLPVPLDEKALLYQYSTSTSRVTTSL